MLISVVSDPYTYTYLSNVVYMHACNHACMMRTYTRMHTHRHNYICICVYIHTHLCLITPLSVYIFRITHVVFLYSRGCAHGRAAHMSVTVVCQMNQHANPASSDPRFCIGPRGTSPGGLSERARVSQPFPGYGGFHPKRPAGEHHEHSGARNRPCGARRCFANFLNGLRKPPKGAHHQHQRGSAEGGCVLGSSQRARGLAPGCKR